MRTLLVVLSFVVAVAFDSAAAGAQSPPSALEAYRELWERLHCDSPGDRISPFPQTDAELRAIIHELHPDRPALQRVAELDPDHPDRLLARAVCAIVPDSDVESSGDGATTFLRVTPKASPALLDLDRDEWSLLDASTGLLVRLVQDGDLDLYGVLTVAHTSNHESACVKEQEQTFVFGLTEFPDPVRRGNSSWIAVGSDQVARARCPLLYLRTQWSDLAFYWVDVDSVERFAPQSGEMGIASPQDTVVAYGFPLGRAMRWTRGRVDLMVTSDREFDTSLYTLAGMSGAPIYSAGQFVGMHLRSVTVSGSSSQCVACPIPCDLRPALEGFITDPPCSGTRSWSTEAGYGELASVFRARILALDSEATADSLRMAVDGGAGVLRIERMRSAPQDGARVLEGEFVLRHDERVILWLPPQGRLHVLVRQSLEESPRWRTRSTTQLMKSAGYRDFASFMAATERFVVADPAGPGGQDFDIVPRLRKSKP